MLRIDLVEMQKIPTRCTVCLMVGLDACELVIKGDTAVIVCVILEYI